MAHFWHCIKNLGHALLRVKLSVLWQYPKKAGSWQTRSSEQDDVALCNIMGVILNWSLFQLCIQGTQTAYSVATVKDRGGLVKDWGGLGRTGGEGCRTLSPDWRSLKETLTFVKVSLPFKSWSLITTLENRNTYKKYWWSHLSLR